MQLAKISRIVAFEVTCPECGELVECRQPNSMARKKVWLPEDVLKVVPEGCHKAVTNCQSCGVEVRFRVPKAAREGSRHV